MNLRNLLHQSFFEHPMFLLRIWLGVAFIMHGLPGVFDADYMAGFAGFMESYGIPFPTLMAYISKGAELICGILLLVGLFTRFASLALICNMLVATFFAMRGDIFGDFQAELSFTYLIISLAVFLSKPTIYSLDNMLFGERKQLELA